MAPCARRTGLFLVAAVVLAPLASGYGVLPLAVKLPPLSKRCIHEEVPSGSEATVELFVERGGKLEVHLTVEGPMTKAWGDVPEASSKTKVLLDEIVTNGHEEDFDDSYLFSFQVRERGRFYL